MTALALFAAPRVRKPRRPRTRFAKSLASYGLDHRTPLGLRRKGWTVVAVVDRGLTFPMARLIVHVGASGEIVCGALGGAYPVESEQRDVLELGWWLARVFPVCERCAIVVKRGYRQYGAGRPPRSQSAVLVARFRNGALPEQSVRPTHTQCSKCGGLGVVEILFRDTDYTELGKCERCLGTGVYPPREAAS